MITVSDLLTYTILFSAEGIVELQDLPLPMKTQRAKLNRQAVMKRIMNLNIKAQCQLWTAFTPFVYMCV